MSLQSSSSRILTSTLLTTSHPIRVRAHGPNASLRRALLTSSRPRRPIARLQTATQTPHSTSTSPAIRPRFFSRASTRPAGIMPDSEDPAAPQQEQRTGQPVAQQATELDEAEFHEHADRFLEELHDRAEAVQETREDVEVEYAAGVLSITFPPNGTYVINKQPPNKQIWLSSPVSGPKRYDWVLAGESMHEKEGGGTGQWVYLRDGTNLSSLLLKELGISVGGHDEAQRSARPDGSEV